ncbi:MAG: 3-deoxy-D-manno-octulosonic acid transferase [Verrucomicrobia bacterium]|nr:3-deoxy-D-manno-octulosonic acid transferase [Verrucomicrobiota bacterium]
MIWILYNLLFPIAFLLMLPKFLSRMARRGGYKKHFEQRLGIYGQGTTSRLDDARRIWIHAVSVGEIQVALRFITAYREKNPDIHFVVSTNTSTAHALGKKEMDPRDVLIYFPVDMPFVMKRAFDAINPLKLILVECEFWPNLIRQGNRRGIPVSLINGRISDSSFRGYMKLRSLIRRLLELIDPICVQGRQDAERTIAMGARPETVKILGTAKYDLPTPAADADAAARDVLRKISVSQCAQILLGGSTWPGEEDVLCEIYKNLKVSHPDLFLVLVPRHAERRDEVAKALEAQQLSFVLRSRMNGGAEKPDVLVVDTTGELMSFYAAADVVFVGKSLCEHGGQNPIEPALFGKAIVVGPNMENFPSVMDDFLSEEALLQVSDFQTLEKTIEKLLSDAAALEQLGAAAQQVVESRRGVIDKMVEAVE